MKLEPLMQRIVELADEVPCRIAYLKDDTVRDRQARRHIRRHIRRQYQSDLQVLGEREALEFARFRADALADAARQAKQSFHRALIIGAIYTATLAFGVGFMIGRAI